MILNGTLFVQKHKPYLIHKFKKIKSQVRLAVIILNGIQNQKDFLFFKKKFATELNVEIIVYDWTNYSTTICLEKLKILSNESNIHGIIFQLPANSNIDINILLENIPFSKDVDGLNPKQLQKKHPFIGASNRAILKLVTKYNRFKNKKILLIGRNPYFAQPLFWILKKRKYHIDMIKFSEYHDSLLSSYEIIISTINQPLFINCEYMKKNSIAIDLTYVKNNIYQKPVGAFYNNQQLKLFTPVPNGLGPMTIYYLFENLYRLIKRNK